PGNNSLVITDYADNLRRLSKIIAALDAPVGGDLDVIPIRNGIASDVAMIVTRLMEPTPGRDPGRVWVRADARTDSVTVRAPARATPLPSRARPRPAAPAAARVPASSRQMRRPTA